MAKIKLHDRVKLDDGQTGSIVMDTGGDFLPLLFVPDNAQARATAFLHREDSRVTEIIGHRYFVDTPYEIGKTYPTRGGCERKVVGVGLIVESEARRVYVRNADGTGCNGWDEQDLILPDTPKPTRTITLDLTEDEIAKVEAALREAK